MMKDFIVGHFKVAKSLGFSNYLKYRLSPPMQAVALNVMGRTLFVRRSSADLTAALSCFNGEFESLKTVFPSDWGGIIVDAGGYIGTAAIAFAELYPNATVLTIEPRPENFELLKRNINGKNNIIPLNGVLTHSKSEKIELFDRKNNEWGWSIIPLKNTEGNGSLTVRNYTIPDLIRDYGEIGILKLDIEGAEKELFDHVTELLHIRAVFVELHDTIKEGCTDSFKKFSEKRKIQKDSGEKYLSIKCS